MKKKSYINNNIHHTFKINVNSEIINFKYKMEGKI